MEGAVVEAAVVSEAAPPLVNEAASASSDCVKEDGAWIRVPCLGWTLRETVTSPWVLWALMFPLYAFQQVCLVAEVAGGWNDEVPTRAVVVVSAADVAE